jgi:predicted enzyme related to lactoylglutathione lyase
MSKNRVVHFEIGAEDPEKLSEFYKKALGWEINLWPGSDYWMVGKTEDRAEGAIKDIEANGGKVVKPLADMPMGPEEIMRWCYCEDPQGNIFGLMQTIKKG